MLHFINFCLVLIIISQTFCLPLTDIEQSDYTNRLDLDNFSRNTENLKDNQIKNDVQQTIDNVKKMLDGDPSLPRLTKGEIEDLFEQVTREEYEKSIHEGDINRAEHMRALMLVLPYNTDNSSKQNLEELFNRPPITKVVESSEPKLQKPLRPVIQSSGKVEIVSIGSPMQITTYKPLFRRKFTNSAPTPITTYHPEQSFSRLPPIGELIDLSNNFEVIQMGGNKPVVIKQSDYPDKFEFTEIKLETTEKPQRFSSHYNSKTISFKKDIYHNSGIRSENSRKTTKTVNRDLEDILNSLGFSSQTESRKNVQGNEDPSEIKIPKAIISSIIKQDRISIEEPSPVNIEDFRNSLVPKPKTEAFAMFKPLNLQSPVQIEPGLEDYLIKFGILESGRNSRSQKVLNVPPIIEKILPSTTTKITISGTTENIVPKVNIVNRIDTNIDESFADGSNIFNPTQTDMDDYKELGRLLKNLRDFQELQVNLTAENLKKLELKNYNLSDSLLAQGPNPIDMPEFADLQKNEVKRQKDDITETTPTRFNLSLDDSDLPADSNTESISSDNILTTENDSGIQTTTEINNTEDDSSLTTTTTTTEESPNGSLSDLEDSFGKSDRVSEKPFPPPQKNGFYFLADINSFLEVGDGAEKVLVRFNPKIGDPSRFIPVKVP